jgi:hypothetical protein
MDQLRQIKNYSDSLIQEVRESLIIKADGMFLGVSLIIEDLIETPVEGISVDSRISESFGQNIRNCGPILKLDANGTIKLTHQSA